MAAMSWRLKAPTQLCEDLQLSKAMGVELRSLEAVIHSSDLGQTSHGGAYGWQLRGLLEASLKGEGGATSLS